MVSEQTTTGVEKLVEETGEPVKQVMSFSQAHQLYKDFVKDNRERNNKNAAITKKRDGEQPFSPRKLKAAGQSWRNNRPTGFMSAMLQRLHPPYKQMVDQLPSLTFAGFPNDSLGSDKHRDAFRRRVTDTIRKWSGWGDFVSQLVSEDLDFGYAAMSWDDEFSWKPKLYRSDEAYFYVGCPQDSAEVEVWGLKQNFPVHEMMAVIQRGQVSKDAGWHLQNVIKKLNVAPKEFDNKSSEENARQMEDLARENNYAAAHGSSIRVVKAGHIFSVNPVTKRVDHYIFDRDDGTPLFFKAAQYGKMPHVLKLFTAEVGDSTLHGSRGAGRVLYNTHVSVEQARNMIQDALHLSGLVLLKKGKGQGGSGTSENIALTVMHPFAVIGDGYEIIEKVKFEVNAEAFFALDRHATAQAEILIGAFLPSQPTMEAKGGPRTASEVNYVASIDAQIKAGSLARFADQLFCGIEEIQRRIAHPDVLDAAEQVFKKCEETQSLPIFDEQLFQTLVSAKTQTGFVFADLPKHVDPDAVYCVLALRQDGLTQQQILILANSPARASVSDAIAAQSGILSDIVARYGVDPVVDTTELKRRDIASKLGGEAAERLMNVDLNPLSDLKQGRNQMLELSAMLSGNEIPVDKSDSDVVHLNVIAQRIEPMLRDPNISPLVSSQQFLQRLLSHAQAHAQAAQTKGVKPDVLAPAMEVISKIEKFVQQMPVEQAAGQAVGQATAPGVVPAGAPAEVVPSTLPGDMIESAASPARPTASGDLKPVSIPLTPQPSSSQPTS